MRLLAVCFAFASLTLSGCKTTTPKTGGEVKSDWMAGSKWQEEGEYKTRTWVIDWPCAIRPSDEGEGLAQDEYCEWGRNELGDSDKLVCEFRTSFEEDRKYWLPMRSSKEAWSHTQFNTLSALKILVEDCTERAGNHCFSDDRVEELNRVRRLTGKYKFDNRVSCDPGRVSDPQVCEDLQRFAFDEGKVVAPVLHERPLKEDKQPMIQLMLTGALPKGCEYDLDPYLKKQLQAEGKTEEEMKAIAKRQKTFVRCELSREIIEKRGDTVTSCDDIAREMRAGTQVRVKKQTATKDEESEAASEIDSEERDGDQMRGGNERGTTSPDDEEESEADPEDQPAPSDDAASGDSADTRG